MIHWLYLLAERMKARAVRPWGAVRTRQEINAIRSRLDTISEACSVVFTRSSWTLLIGTAFILFFHSLLATSTSLKSVA